MEESLIELDRLYAQKRDVEEKYSRFIKTPDNEYFREELRSLMDLSNAVDIKIMAFEKYLRDRKLAKESVDWNSDANKYAEGQRQFMIKQFEELTGKTIKQVLGKLT